MMEDEQAGRHAEFVRRVLVVLALASLFFLVWQLRWLFLLVFGSVLVAVIFRSIADPIRHRTRLNDRASVSLAVLIVFFTFFLVLWIFGTEIARQIYVLADTLPEAWRSLERRLSEAGLAQPLETLQQQVSENGSSVLSQVSRFAVTFGSGLADTVVVIFGGIYLAYQPRFYHRGVLKLVPPRSRALADDALNACGRALRLWLKGQLVSMLVIGLAIGIGLWLIGVPSALALGLVAGVLEFIPYAGPILAAVPALLMAIAEGPQTVLLVAGLFVLVQQIEGNLLQPLVQQYAVELPPVILLFALLGFGMMFGVVGVLLATPLAVVAYVLVKRLYVQETLHTPTSIPGEDTD